MDGDGDLRRELQDWLSSLPRRRLEEDAECRRLQESVSVLVGPSSRHTRDEIRRLMKSWGVKTTRATRTLPQQREALWAHLVQVGRSLMQDPEALRAMSQWLASLPLELVRRRGAHARLQESVDALLQPSDRTSRDKIARMLVAWGQGSGREHERAAAARGRLCATVLRVGGELQRAQNRDRPALKAARAWMREVPESALADSPALKRLRTSLFNVEETLQDIHALAAHGVVCTQPDGRKRPAWHIEADLCDSLEAAVLHQKKLRGAEQPAQAQEDGVLGQEATAAGPCSGQEDPLVRVQRLHGMELLNADSWLQARTPADPDAESLQRDVREVLTYLGCPGTEGPLHLWAVTAGRNVEETAQMLLRAVSLRQRRWRALQSPLTPALRQDDREMPAFSAGFRLTGRRWALGQAALRVFLLERGVAMEEVAMKACMGLVDNLRKGTAGDTNAERLPGIHRRRKVQGKYRMRAPALRAYQFDKVCLYDLWDGLPPKQQGEVHAYILHFLEPTSRAAQPACLRSADAVYATLRADSEGTLSPYFRPGRADMLVGAPAWLSLRMLASLELPDTPLEQMPLAHEDLFEDIRASRRAGGAGVAVTAEGLQAILLIFSNDPWSAYEKRAWLHQALGFRGLSTAVQEKANLVLEEGFAEFVADVARAGVPGDLLPLGAWATLALYVLLTRRDQKPLEGSWPCLLRAFTAPGYVPQELVVSQTPLPLQTFPAYCSEKLPANEAGTLPVPSALVMCWLCGAGFNSRVQFKAHAEAHHGGIAEYRKRLFWQAQEEGFVPLLPWIKRHILQRFAFFQTRSFPHAGHASAGLAFHAEETARDSEPRREEACAICARLGFLETRVRVYLWKTPEGEERAPVLHSRERDERDEDGEGQEGEEETQVDYATRADGLLCVGDAEAANKLLSTQLYMQRMPLIPEEELLASSRRHPLHPAMTWLLHTRRVPTLPPRQLLELALNSPAH